MEKKYKTVRVMDKTHKKMKEISEKTSIPITKIVDKGVDLLETEVGKWGI